MILYDVISEADRMKLKSIMPKSWKVKRPQETHINVDMSIKVTEIDIKDMAKMPQGR